MHACLQGSCTCAMHAAANLGNLASHNGSLHVMQRLMMLQKHRLRQKIVCLKMTLLALLAAVAWILLSNKRRMNITVRRY